MKRLLLWFVIGLILIALGVAAAVFFNPLETVLLSQNLRGTKRQMLQELGVRWNAPDHWLLYAVRDGTTGQLYVFGSIPEPNVKDDRISQSSEASTGLGIWWLRLSDEGRTQRILMTEMSSEALEFFNSAAGRKHMQKNTQLFQWTDYYIIDRLSDKYTEIHYPASAVSITFEKQERGVETKIATEASRGFW